MKKSSLRSPVGFTLVEVLIVLAILGAIAALVLPRVTGGLDKSKVKEAKVQIGQIAQALSMYYTDCGSYPSSLEGLVKATDSCKNWGPEPYMKKSPVDPWGTPFVYSLDGGNFNIKSLGKDKKEGGDGFDKDISLEDLE